MIYKLKEVENKIFRIENENEFNEIALYLYDIHLLHNPVYREYVRLLNLPTLTLKHYSEIPFLPISLFKTQPVYPSFCQPLSFFQSSGTGSSGESKHYISDFQTYTKSFLQYFHLRFGHPKDYRILGLLPNYMENTHSSLLYMIKNLMDASGHSQNGFYLHNHEELALSLEQLEKEGQAAMLWGVSFALLDFAEKYKLTLKNTLIVETGGMKGKRKELLRSELHARLKASFSQARIYSEYGMCELFSQAYTDDSGLFSFPSWAKAMLRNVYDPLCPAPKGKSGGLNIIDLANLYSCPFIATQDLGRLHENGKFEVLGRFDQSDIRGCNLLVD